MNYILLERIVDECIRMGGKKDLDVQTLANNLGMSIHELGKYVTVNPDKGFFMPDEKAIARIRRKARIQDKSEDWNVPERHKEAYQKLKDLI